MYFDGSLEIWNLTEYYKKHYNDKVTLPPPPYPANMGEKYFENGIDFFNEFSFDKSKYEVVFIEDTIHHTHNGINLTVKPDLLLKHKETGRLILIDYKSSKLQLSGKDGSPTKKDREKLEGYTKQMILYAHFINIARDIKVDKIDIWFTRNLIVRTIEITDDLIEEVLEWFETTITNIRTETEWKPSNTKDNQYFCKFICSVRNDCEHT